MIIDLSMSKKKREDVPAEIPLPGGVPELQPEEEPVIPAPRRQPEPDPHREPGEPPEPTPEEPSEIPIPTRGRSTTWKYLRRSFDL